MQPVCSYVLVWILGSGPNMSITIHSNGSPIIGNDIMGLAISLCGLLAGILDTFDNNLLCLKRQLANRTIIGSVGPSCPFQDVQPLACFGPISTLFDDVDVGSLFTCTPVHHFLGVSTSGAELYFK